MKQEKTPSACIWMQAGVVKSKPCYKDFHCHECRFDRAMARVCRSSTRTARTKDFIFWQEKLLARPASARPCIHHMKGRIGFRACHQSYRCTDCEFDQFFQDQFRVAARMTPLPFERIRGYALPAGYYLSRAHVWIRIEGRQTVSLGVDDFISRLLEPFHSTSLPLMGEALEQGGTGFSLGHNRETAPFPAPVTGVVTDVNPEVFKRPSIINRSPYTGGWLFTLTCRRLKKELRSLCFMDSATAFVADEARKLDRYLEDHAGLAAADGGEPVREIASVLGPGAWSDMARRFIPAPASSSRPGPGPGTGH